MGGSGVLVPGAELLAPGREVEPPPRPLHFITVPPEHCGRNGALRLPKTRCKVDVDEDLPAIRLWIATAGKTPATRRTYTRAAERLLNWALLVRHRAVSSLTRTDFAHFYRFLGRPYPEERWIQPERVTRNDPRWRPFLAPLGSTAGQATMQCVSSLASWMCTNGYAELDVGMGRACLESGCATADMCAAIKPRSADDGPCVADWVWLHAALQRESHFDLEARLVAELMFYAAAWSTEIVRLRTSDFACVRLDDAPPRWRLRSDARRLAGARIAILPPLAETLERYLGWTGRSDDGDPRRVQRARVPGHVDGRLLPAWTADRIGRAVDRLATLSATLAEREGHSAAADRLRHLSCARLSRMLLKDGTVSADVWLALGRLPSASTNILAYLPRTAAAVDGAAHRLAAYLRSGSRC
jgi:hypothetical protein